jgi:uncharacterized lipoprotein YddW (UPF0748 family)
MKLFPLSCSPFTRPGRLFLLTGFTLAILAGCAGEKPAVKPETKPEAAPASTAASETPRVPPTLITSGGSLHTPPAAPREFRAAWVASVGNIDWPSHRGLPAAKQQAELLAILDTAAALHLNAIVLQVRPGADALYPSELEPWSEYLSGEQGKPPSPYYDPLQMWVEEAHKRGLELHAWFNPYRARSSQSSRSVMAASHVSKRLPGIVRQYGDMLWMDPGEDASAQQTLAVIADVVKRYDIDGVHIDDYFYPYPVSEKINGQSVEQDFPDDAAWQRYLQQGGKLSRADWRRDNVNRLVQQIGETVHKEKSWVKFGISPFGIGRPDRLPPGIIGFSQYDKLYADVETWLQNGWMDYLSPQLYWPIEQAPQAYKVLLDYWLAQDTKHRHLWPGLYTSRVSDADTAWPAQEIVNQIVATRQREEADGHLHFSMSTLMRNKRQVRELLLNSSYPAQALVPATPWLGCTPPAAPQLQRNGNSLQVQAAPGSRMLAIWKRYDLLWQFSVQPASQTAITLADDPVYGAVQEVQVSATDKLGNEGQRSALMLTEAAGSSDAN